jgi:hypothetical protein
MFTLILFLITSYLLATTQEWLIHKYLMHSNIITTLHDEHINHHKKTKKDYSITYYDSDYICVNMTSINDIIQAIILIFINSYILYSLFTPYVSIFAIILTVTILFTINILIWNTLHPYVHNLDPYTVCNFPKGLYESLINKNNIYVNWAINNHKSHHYNSKGNFNIVFPGADYLFGTYNNKY